MKTHFVAFVDIPGFAGAVEALDGVAFGRVVDYWAKGILPRFDSPAYSLANAYEIWTRQFDVMQSQTDSAFEPPCSRSECVPRY